MNWEDIFSPIIFFSISIVQHVQIVTKIVETYKEARKSNKGVQRARLMMEPSHRELTYG
jgi:hypothetical protein